ncbi:antibiotic biosynthesis monooxygenase [Mycoplasma nasistruthionis]|uniref:Antibiotic biosynthesis monooxygenase n=1 Tax=Mycoplasma nasistruthionis TaxID=353852 RepID=A0A4Y6I600_9MOLU|nr:antibiotic biosynthesis monooxygenase [Mycoplasma nasistruthionis]QDF64771.1 antibiotic biosynthesis monooxygenase [Mycoplasma nasistruthionis]
MIFAKATKYTINPEKLKVFIDYLFVLTKKTRVQEFNLSFEYALETNDKILILERWSTKEAYKNFIHLNEFKKELKTLEKMSKHTEVLYEVELAK